MSKYRVVRRLSSCEVSCSWEDLQDALDDIDVRLASIENRLDRFHPLLAGDKGKIETAVACLECNQDDAQAAYESLDERLTALEGGEEATGKRQNEITLYDVVAKLREAEGLLKSYRGKNTEAWNLTYEMGEFVEWISRCAKEHQTAAEYVAKDETAQQTKRQQLAEAFLKAALKRSAQGIIEEVSYKSLANALRQVSGIFSGAWSTHFIRMATVLEQAAKDEAGE